MVAKMSCPVDANVAMARLPCRGSRRWRCRSSRRTRLGFAHHRAARSSDGDGRLVRCSPPRARSSMMSSCCIGRANRDCDVCPFKLRCCPKEPARKIPRRIYEDARDVARALGKTEAFEQSRHDGSASKCCSPTSSASAGSAASVCVVLGARKTSSHLRLSPRPSVGSPTSSPDRLRRSLHVA
jgi:hypothetical protein